MRSSLFLLAVLFAAAAQAVTIEHPLADPAQEQVARTVIRQLNCVVCEGQALAESDARFAREMRQEVRRMAAEGLGEAAIIGYFRERYGARILLTPPVEAATLPLWLAPLGFLLAGAAWLWRSTRRKRA